MNTFDPNFPKRRLFFKVGVKTLIANAKGEILILRRSDKCTRPGGWDFPGGGIEYGEDPYEAAVREAYEETGLTIEQPRLIEVWCDKKKDGNPLVILGMCTQIDEGTVTLSWEHDYFEWMSREKVKQMQLPEFHSQVFEKYLKLSMSA